jgi:hypothetical protein
VVKVVTLLVKPEEAERLALASHEGVLRLAMRNYDDRSIVLSNGADVSHLQSVYSLAKPVTVRQGTAAARPAPYRVEIMRDGKAAQSASFIYSAPVNRQTSFRNEHWLPVNDDPPAAIARPAKGSAGKPQPSAMAGDSAGAAAADVPRGPQQREAADSAEAGIVATPLSKTIDVDP